MNVIKTAIEGVVIIEPRIFEDARGYFFESFSQREFDEKVAPVNFVQDNESKYHTGYFVDFISKNRRMPKASWCAVSEDAYWM